MKKIFIGMMFVFLDFFININASSIGLIPDFVGYIFMFNGLTELIVFSDRFSKVKPYVVGMAVYSGILYILDLFGGAYMLGDFTIIVLGLISTIVSLYISYCIIAGIKDIEAVREQNLNSPQLYSTWKLLAIFTFVSQILLFVPALAIICIIISFIIGIYYLVVFNRSKNLFYELNPGIQ